MPIAVDQGEDIHQALCLFVCLGADDEVGAKCIIVCYLENTKI